MSDHRAAGSATIIDVEAIEVTRGLDSDPWADEIKGAGDETQAIPVPGVDDDDGSASTTLRDESGEEFRFSFDDERS